MNKEQLLLATFNKILRSSFISINVPRRDVPEWDSMKHAELLLALQKSFNLKFNIEDVLEMDNLQDFLPLL
ncbi:MAG: hypothetical protein WC635_06900 [Bacteriovorax sp.]|jgi:acyl carrier protein